MTVDAQQIAPMRKSLARRFADSYFGRACLSPTHAFLWAGVACASYVGHVGGIWALAPIVSAAIVVALPRSARFRDGVDEERRGQLEAARKANRKELMSKMEEPHQQTALELIDLATDVQRGFSPNVVRQRTQTMDDIDDLVDVYCQRAVLHAEARALLRRYTAPDASDEGGAKAKVPDEEVDVAALQNIRRARIACRSAAAAKLAVVATDLAAIEETLKLAHERLVLDVDTNEANERIKALLDSIDREEAAIEGVRALGPSSAHA